jgi:hypothetical protein
MDDPSGLTAFQLDVARLFFAQPASATFLLAGGGALLAHGLGSRPTQDLDFFTRPGGGDVGLARDEFIHAASARGWGVDVIRDTDTFVRLVVHGVEDLLVDLAMDSAPGRPPTVTLAGPTYAPEELAGRKVVALFDRAAARDFVDVFALARVYDRERLLRSAAEVDAGFDRLVFADMLDSIGRYRDIDLHLGDVDVQDLRAFAATWGAELRAGR